MNGGLLRKPLNRYSGIWRAQEQKFLTNALLQDATVRRIEIIGEAARNIPKEFKDKYPFVEWKKIIGTRDIIVHAYFETDLDIAWDIVKKDIPDLKEKIKKVLEQEKAKSL